uniref:Uncharacterized protein n=1 Tax=Anguilla anguilla TaxID=7936 RepID=A0A0E9T4E5_ANGAN
MRTWQGARPSEAKGRVRVKETGFAQFRTSHSPPCSSFSKVTVPLSGIPCSAPR